MSVPNSNEPSNIEAYLLQLVELNQVILRELRLQTMILAQNGIPMSDDLDQLRLDPATNDYQRST